jgi:hypothetical protein
MKMVQLSGHVSIEVRNKFIAEVAQLEWTDPKQALKDVVDLKGSGREAWKAGNIKVAYEFWRDAVMVFRRILRGSS